jgi:hypothetical protein
VTRSLEVCKKIKIKLWMLVDEWCHGRFVKHGLGSGNKGKRLYHGKQKVGSIWYTIW